MGAFTDSASGYPLKSENPPLFTRLRIVELSSFYSDSIGWTGLQEFLYALSEISSAHHTLETLELRLVCPEEPEFVDGSEWKQIDEALEHFTRLNSVKVVMRHNFSDTGQMEEVLKAVRSFMVSCSRRGILDAMLEHLDTVLARTA
ncbi:hypothetical protein AX16_003351 [Volvariella volvacea WC 439]|nr:hypothetical protein AX16_003351 [Volvariella volvacea WC 439]